MAAPTDLQYELHVLMISKSKLKSSIRSSTLLAGFAIVRRMTIPLLALLILGQWRDFTWCQIRYFSHGTSVGLVEIEVSPTTPPGLLILFAMHSAILVFIHLLSLMLATFLLPELEAAGTGDLASFQQHNSLDIAKSFTVQLCWILSNVVGIILLISEIILVAFVKFYPTDESPPTNIHAATGTILILLVLCILAIPLIIYQSRVVAKHKLKFHERGLGQARQMLEDINIRLEAATDMAEVGGGLRNASRASNYIQD